MTCVRVPRGDSAAQQPGCAAARGGRDSQKSRTLRPRPTHASTVPSTTAVTHHLFPSSSCARNRTSSSSSVHSVRLMDGSSTLIHRSRHCLVDLSTSPRPPQRTPKNQKYSRPTSAAALTRSQSRDYTPGGHNNANTITTESVHHAPGVRQTTADPARRRKCVTRHDKASTRPHGPTALQSHTDGHSPLQHRCNRLPVRAPLFNVISEDGVLLHHAHDTQQTGCRCHREGGSSPHPAVPSRTTPTQAR